MDLLPVQGTLKCLVQHHSSKASILQYSAFFMVQLSHPYLTTRKTIALTRWTFVNKVMSQLFNMLSRLVIAFLPRSKHLLIPRPSRLSQNSGFELPASCSKFPLTVCTYISALSIRPPHPCFPCCVRKSVLCVCLSISALQIGSSVPSF